jgi:putative peptide zinc metalloprotease protein
VVSVVQLFQLGETNTNKALGRLRIVVAFNALCLYDLHPNWYRGSDERSKGLGMRETHVKLRSDLEIRSEADSGIILKDPITRRFYRFVPVQASAIRLLDGSLSLEAIARTVAEKLQTEVLESQMEDFVGKLRSLLLLDHPYCWSMLENAAQKKRTAFRSLLSIKIHRFNPDSLLTRLEKSLRFCFSPAFFAIACVAIVVSTMISVSNWDSLFISTEALLSLYSIPLIVIVVSAVLTIHEFAHGLTLKHYGGKVDEMGFMLLYFIPAFYCNVSDAWMLKKRERIWVSLSGGFIQIFIWGLATIVWRILAPETPASHICIIAIAFAGIQTLFNFNPLIRLDGYYLLSDAIEVTNLRPKALSYIKNRMRSLLTGTPSANIELLEPRERRLFFWYGAAASLFTTILICFMLERIGGWMIREYRFWGILFTSALFLAIVPIAKKENMKASQSLLKGVVLRIRKAPMGFILIALMVLGGGFLPWQLKISGDFTITAAQRVSITPQVIGHLKKIHADQGSRVHAGELLAEIENLDLVNAYEDAKGELKAQRASLDLLKAGSRPEEIQKAQRLIETKRAELSNVTRNSQERAMLRETIAKREAELANARLNYERSQKLLADGLIPRNEADRDRTAYEVQKKELAEAEGQLNILDEQTDRNQDIKHKELAQAQSELTILLAGSRKESIRAAESQVAKLEEKLNILSRQKELLQVRSLIEGVVATPHLQDRIGDFLDKGSILCEIVSEGSAIVEMPVPEKEIGDVRTGYPIALKVRGFPKRAYQAHVIRIAPTAVANGSERTVMVQGNLKNPDAELKAGMSGAGKILCGRRTIYEIAFRRAIRWVRTEFWEYLP